MLNGDCVVTFLRQHLQTWTAKHMESVSIAAELRPHYFAFGATNFDHLTVCYILGRVCVQNMQTRPLTNIAFVSSDWQLLFFIVSQFTGLIKRHDTVNMLACHLRLYFFWWKRFEQDWFNEGGITYYGPSHLTFPLKSLAKTSGERSPPCQTPISMASPQKVPKHNANIPLLRNLGRHHPGRGSPR